MAESAPFWHRKTFMIITGASQGIGRNFAVEFGRLLKAESIVVLMARSASNLEQTKELILKANPNISVQIHPIDLSEPDIEKYRAILQAYKGSACELQFLVHNAASIICDTPASKMGDVNTWQKYMSLNLYSVAVLTTAFLELFPSGERCLLNVSSIAGVQPLKGLGYYCIGKASREMYFRMLAEEDPSLNILNYSPGPIDTAMYSQVLEKCCAPETKSIFENMKAGNSVVKLEDTTNKVIRVLGNRSYKSGDRIDFFDRKDLDELITNNS